MIVVSFDKEMREAFAAGQASVMYQMIGRKKTDAATQKFIDAIPKTYEEWIATKANEPEIARG